MKPTYLVKKIVEERIRNALLMLEGSPVDASTLALAKALIGDVVTRAVRENLVWEPPDITVKSDSETGTLYVSWPKDWRDSRCPSKTNSE